MSELNRDLVSTTGLNLSLLDTPTFAALSMAMLVSDRVDPENIAFEPCKKFRLIRENGVPFDRASLQAALKLEMDRRAKTDTTA